jgi:outer membrane protein assembly factor BamB
MAKRNTFAHSRWTSFNDLAYVGIRGSVAALDRATGETVWQTPLKGASFVNVTFDGGTLLAATRGEVYRLNPATGQVLWHNPLKGLGFGLVAFASTRNDAPIAERMRQDQQAAAGAAAGAAAAS